MSPSHGDTKWYRVRDTLFMCLELGWNWHWCLSFSRASSKATLRQLKRGSGRQTWQNHLGNVSGDDGAGLDWMELSYKAFCTGTQELSGEITSHPVNTICLILWFHWRNNVWSMRLHQHRSSNSLVCRDLFDSTYWYCQGGIVACKTRLLRRSPSGIFTELQEARTTFGKIKLGLLFEMYVNVASDSSSK